jgi:hypothetical protein
MSDDPPRVLRDRPALRDLLEKVAELARKRAEEIKQSQTQYADPELVKEALARAKRVLATSLRNMPTTSKRIH